MFVAALQNGVCGGQSGFERHWTHSLVVVLQTGVEPVQAVVSPALHCTHVPAPAPASVHAGLTAVGHAEDTAAPKLPLQGEHTLLVHTGLSAAHWVLDVQFTHKFVTVLHTGVPPEQREEFVAEH